MKDFNLKVYKGTREENKNLKIFAREWCFWDFYIIVDFYKKNIINIIYAVNISPTKSIWCGCVIYSIFDNKIDVFYIYTKLNYRRKKISFNLLVFLQKKIQKNKSGMITLEVSANNIKAIKLYLKFNMLKIGNRYNYYNQKKDALVFCKKIGT